MNTITLLDCAFTFFANFPCRLAVFEMKFDLPSEDRLYKSPHPFSEANFLHSRQVTTYEAFLSLFGRKVPETASDKEKNRNPLDFNIVDMFILVHRRLPKHPDHDFLLIE
jgi:hypothetical protein